MMKSKIFLLSGNTQQILTALNGGKVPVAAAAQSEGQIATGAVIGTFTVRNEHGLHARPSAVLVNEVKKFHIQDYGTKSYSRNCTS